MHFSLLARAAAVAMVASISASAHAATVFLDNEDPGFIEGSGGFGSYGTSQLRWSDGIFAGNAQISLNNVQGRAALGTHEVARFAIGSDTAGRTAGGVFVDGPDEVRSGDGVVTSTTFRFLDFGNQPGISTIDFALFDDHGDMVTELSEVDARVVGGSAASAVLSELGTSPSDLGRSAFRLTVDSQGGEVDVIFTSTTRLLSAMGFDNYAPADGTVSDWVALSVSREVEAATVPLPATAWLVIGGIGILGAAARRQG